ncbi:MAG: pyridoxamine 5'-phosphate oxidase family protein [Oscillospiraceae bacterium]
MRRKNQQLSPEEAEDILRAGTSGVLALAGDNGYPYAVPMSYVYSGGKIYFHCAKEGHKLDSMLRCDKASFCVIGQDNIIPEEYTTYYKSVIAFGRIRFAETLSELTEGARLLAEKYCPDNTEESFLRELDSSMGRLCIPVLDIEHMTGKEAAEPKK